MFWALGYKASCTWVFLCTHRTCSQKRLRFLYMRLPHIHVSLTDQHTPATALHSHLNHPFSHPPSPLYEGCMEESCVCLFSNSNNENEKLRQFWTHPINNARFFQGEFYTLYGDLKPDNSKFFNYFMMSNWTFQELLARVTNGIKLQDTNMRPPEEAVALSIR